MQEKSGEKLNIFSFSATSFIAMDRYESVDLFQAPVNSNVFWILVPAVLLLILVGGKQETKSSKRNENSHWIYHPHVTGKDDYECSNCHARSYQKKAVCAGCGTRMTGKTVKNEKAWYEEEEELDILLDDE
jgi:hypothetical protein